MENEYGITVANKYALFLNEDEDSLEILKLQPAKKSEKTKKSASKEKEAKPSTTKQNGSSNAGQDKKTEKVDQFSAPTTNSEPVMKAAGVPVQGTVPTTTADSHFESGRANRPQRDRAKPRSSGSRDVRDQPGESNKGSSEPFHDSRPPRIRARTDRGSGGYPRPERRGFGENRQFRSENEAGNENTEKPNSSSNFERREHRPPRNGFSDQSARPEGDRFSVEASEQSGGRGDRADRDGYSGRGYSRRGGYGYRGRIRTDRNQYSERGDQDRTPARFEDSQGRPQEERQAREGFNDNDGGNFMERSDREGFVPRRDSRGRRGGFGRGRGGFDRPPRRDYQRYGDRRQRSREAEGEAPSDENKITSTDEPKLQQQPDNLHEGGGTSWAEQIDAADQEAKKENLNLEEEAGGDANEAGEEPDVMTLDEWKAREDNKRVKAEFNIRKPGEGYNTDPQWKKMYVLSKKERTEEHDEEDEQEEEHHFKTRNVLPIEIHFADDSTHGSRGRGGGGGGGGGGRRGGMGGPRGRGGRGGSGVGRWESDEFRGDSSRGQTRGGRGSYSDSRTYIRGRGGAGTGRRERTPNFADESDFPSLGSNAQP